MRVAAAAHVTVGLDGGAGRLRAVVSRLQGGPFSGGQKDDIAARQVARVHIVVIPPGKLPYARAVQVHFKNMIESVFRQVCLDRFVLDFRHVRIVTAPREHYLASIIGDIRAQEVAFRPIRRNATDLGCIPLEPGQEIQAAAATREPAVILIGYMREHGRGPLHKENIIEIEERIAQG
ncbi:MAG: hypothetical protein BWY09_02090 [Candidatus Hydrogenedentes bacterium ADurb.Bin179]|nr:MAG: hypothetical protein BWY09_02090 [Candidatus Hydrogenedentes bacterium ADurb.Bin179]